MRRLAVLGQPIAHSRSPAIHNAAFAALGLADQWTYEAIEVAREEFDERARGLAAEGFVGANVTIPHKRAALQLADEASQEAEMIGAANTLAFDGTRTRADNTDGAGLRDADEVNQYKTNPLRADTDSDGAGDGVELRGGTNPLNGRSHLGYLLANLPVLGDPVLVTVPARQQRDHPVVLRIHIDKQGLNKQAQRYGKKCATGAEDRRPDDQG